ncbi:diversity-generating retroelement protein Avd [Patescibacteria group bacterium]|nr:diversity-generating retroelement protein Avd [Patescibacteria group bacterium]MBU4455665.1 diversity-generating retroelement protein Avd [Patescibacteria group bacterium]
MSRYTHLPIFQKSYDLAVRFFQETHSFSREHKFNIGQKIKDINLELLDWIIIANSEKDKKPAFKEINLRVEKLRIYTRLCFDLKIIGIKKYEVLSKYIDEIGRMIGGWMKSDYGPEFLK